MKPMVVVVGELALLELTLLLDAPAAAQTSAFTYQGRLSDGGGPADGNYDFSAGLYPTNAGGMLFALPVTNLNVAVSNGLFTIPLDFGPVFDGTALWVELSVRTNGTGAFTVLSPRQPLSSPPYAQFALTAGKLNGTLSGGGLAGAYGGSVVMNNPSNQFGGTFSGNAAGATNLQVSNLAPGSGVLPEGALSYGVASDDGSAYASVVVAGRRYRVPLTNSVAYSNLLNFVRASTNQFGSAAYTSAGSYDLAGAAQRATNSLPAAAFYTNLELTPYGGMVGDLGHASGFPYGGIMPSFTVSDSASQQPLVILGDDVLNAGSGWAGQLAIAGAPQTDGNYRNIAGFHIENLNLTGYDNRAFCFRIKDPSPPGGGDYGSYLLLEGRYRPGAPDADTTYYNWLEGDNTGNVGIGDLGWRSDGGEGAQKMLHPPAKVTVYGSPNGNYPAFAVIPAGYEATQAAFQIDSNGDAQVAARLLVNNGSAATVIASNTLTTGTVTANAFIGDGSGLTNVSASNLVGQISGASLPLSPSWVLQATNSLLATNCILIRSNTLAHNGDQLWFNFQVLANGAGAVSRTVIMQINSTNVYSQSWNLAYSPAAPAWLSFSGKLVRLDQTNCCVMDGLLNGAGGCLVGADYGGGMHDMNGRPFYLDTATNNCFLVFQNANDSGIALVAGSVFRLSSQ